MEQAAQNSEGVRSSNSERSLAAGGLLCAGGVVAAVAFFDPVNAGFFPACPLYSSTGIYCPGCGLTRGLHALLHGDVVGALDFNLLLPIYVLVAFYLIASLVMTVYRGRGLKLKVFDSKWLWGFLIFSLAFGILRNIPVYPLNILAP